MRLVDEGIPGSIVEVSVLEISITDSGHQGMQNINYIVTPALRDALQIFRVPSS